MHANSHTFLTDELHLTDLNDSNRNGFLFEKIECAKVNAYDYASMYLLPFDFNDLKQME